MADFKAVAAAALARADTLVPELLPGGKRQGHEWICADLTGGPGRSTSVNLTSGLWADFSSGQKGGDLISLVAAQRGLSQAPACEALAELLGLSDTSPKPLRRSSASVERPAEPIPPEEKPPLHTHQSALYWYHSAAGERLYAITRLDTPEGKQFRQWTWRTGKWVAQAYPSPRPVYRLPELLQNPDLPVLIVEGEKCADAAAALLTGRAVISWSGGAQAVNGVDWSHLAGRDVTIWPDADDPGAKAAASIAQKLLPLASKVAVVVISGQPPGWDIADAIADGWDADLILAWAAERTRVIPRPESKTKVGRPHSGPPPIDAEDPGPSEAPTPSAMVRWQSLGLDCNSGGVPFPSMANVELILERHPSTRSRIWFDDFRQKIMVDRADDKTEPWTDADDLRLVSLLQRGMALPKIGLQTAVHAVQLVAYNNRRNSVATWLDSLTWDGTERLAQWTSDFLGTPNTAFEQAVGRNWLISMVARAYKPGCKVDHMPVLEGKMGRGKSTALAVLGGQWYRAAPQAFGSKEFLEVIQGAWLVEIPDMVGFGRREHSQIISAITMNFDPFRKAYGRNAEDYQRTAIFAATSETDEYLQDSRGIRRYWPLRCSEINVEALRNVRDQLFAEAVAAYKSGATWHEMPEKQTAAEQSARQETDPWLGAIEQWLASRRDVTVDEVADFCLKIEIAKYDGAVKRRIGKCLKFLGYEVIVTKDEKRKSLRTYRKWVPEDENNELLPTDQA